MEIKIDIKVPSDNTNTPHGEIKLKTEGRYTYIAVQDKAVAVDASELYRAVIALHKE